MKGYKAFEKGLICKGKQYAENTVFEEEKAEICKCGMHFCKNPLDVLDYYPLVDNNGDLTEFAEVEALDEAFTNDKKKYCTKKLKIGAKLDLRGFIKASFDVNYQQIKEEVDITKDELKEKDGDNVKLVGGDYATLAGGDWATLAGGNNVKLAGGYNATLAGGYNATLAGGDWATLAGDNCAKLAGGDYATLAGGDKATLAGGKHSIMVSENGSKAKGDIGSVIIMIKRNDEGKIINYKAIQIDGEKYKADTMYQLIDGEIVEVENETT